MPEISERQLADLARSIRERILRDLAVPTFQPATVHAYDSATNVATVHLDSDTDPAVRVPAESFAGTVADGDRVMVLFQPPHGHFVAWAIP